MFHTEKQCKFININLYLILIVLITPSIVFAGNEYNEAEDFIASYGLKAAVSQLLIVGITSDYNNISNNKQTRDLLSLNVGGVIINSYNLPSYNYLEKFEREKALNLSKSFIRKIKQLHPRGEDLLISIDFESDKYSSIKYPLITPPSALTISASNSIKISSDVGTLVGEQLSDIGVNVLLGPVLDIDESIQGERNSNLTNRSFGGDSNIVNMFAGSFMEGVKKSGVAIFAKHFPGYSHVSSNPHYSNEARYNGNHEKLLSILSPFNNLESNIDGVMTSHIIINDNKMTNRPATLSSKTIKKLLNTKELSSIKDKIFITDDISNMQAIINYKNDNGLSNADIVLNSFKSGHDLILISHMEHHSNNQFTINDVKKSIELLNDYASTKQGKEKLIVSLNKILALKKELIKNKKRAKQQYVNNNKYKEVKRNTFIQSMLLINNNSLSTLSFAEISSKSSPVNIIGSSKYFKEIKKVVPESKYMSYHDVNKLKKLDRNKIISVGKNIKRLIENGHFVVFIVNKMDDFNTVDWLRLNNIDPSKLLISIHNSISMLSSESIGEFAIVSNFSDDKESSIALGMLLNGEITPKNINNSPLSIGNGAFFDLKNRKKPELNGNESSYVLSLIDNEDNIRKKPSDIVFSVMAFIPFFLIFLSTPGCYAKNNLKRSGCGSNITRYEFYKDSYLEYKIRTFVAFIFFILASIMILIFGIPDFLAKTIIADEINENTPELIKYLLHFLFSYFN